ncbi:MAG: extracellular solute-binding protein [Chromatiaceae bacterium]|nr:extracellular solute-binding protein [Chromatiaceae bacterium]MCP5314784.1 extracellular solute-binding protein [Chromatiaceae bacterium]
MLRRMLPLLLISLSVALPVSAADEVVVYSARNEHLIKPLFDRYTAETGVPIRFITDKEGPLLQRLKAEGARTPADMLITVDAGNLWHAAETGVLAEIDSPVLDANVPSNLRDPKGRWFGLSERARTIVYSTERVQPGMLSSYEDLADPKWKGRLCLRTSKKVYNQSLVATLIARLGEQNAEQIVRGWVTNLATAPFANDTKAMQAVAAGQCDVTVVNTYYFGRLQKENPDIKLAIFWPNQDSSGVHINVSGAGVTRHAKHPDEARRLLEWLSSEEAQADFAGLNMEYPVNSKVAVDPLVASWGSFKADALHVNEAGRLQADAIRLMDRAGYR